jgi:hypothetical protein
MLQPRLLRLCLLLPASVLFGVALAAGAQDNHVHAEAADSAPPMAMKKLRWSDPAASA